MNKNEFGKSLIVLLKDLKNRLKDNQISEESSKAIDFDNETIINKKSNDSLLNFYENNYKIKSSNFKYNYRKNKS